MSFHYPDRVTTILRTLVTLMIGGGCTSGLTYLQSGKHEIKDFVAAFLLGGFIAVVAHWATPPDQAGPGAAIRVRRMFRKPIG